MTYQIVSKGRGALHIDGLSSVGRYSKYAGSDARDLGYVEYAPESACAGLTRLGAFRFVWHETDTLEEALTKADLLSRVYGSKVCATCRKRAEEALK